MLIYVCCYFQSPLGSTMIRFLSYNPPITGQCWQADPDRLGLFNKSPQVTLLGGDDGGRYESVVRTMRILPVFGSILIYYTFLFCDLLKTCDSRNPDRPIFFMTEGVSTIFVSIFDDLSVSIVKASFNNTFTIIQMISLRRYEDLRQMGTAVTHFIREEPQHIFPHSMSEHTNRH